MALQPDSVRWILMDWMQIHLEYVKLFSISLFLGKFAGVI